MLLGIGIGLLINIRIMGVLLFTCLAGCMFLDWLLVIKLKEERLRALKRLLQFVSVTLLALYISWPYLWPDPIGRFSEIFHNMSHFRWRGDNLFDGKQIPATSLP